MKGKFYLNRTRDIQGAIDYTYQQLQKSSINWNWQLTSKPHYKIAEIDEHILIKSLIKDKQLEYTILEVGSARGQWLESAKNHITMIPICRKIINLIL